MKDIMNQVLVAQKRAQANIITRREETASTRSLLNTAKLMEENEMLFKLKQMEYVEKIAEKIGAAHGRLVYWRDAWDDQKSDLKKGRFNPFFHLEKRFIQERIETAWADFSSTLKALPFHRHAQLLTHVSDNTARRHVDFLSAEKPEQKKKRKRDRTGDDNCCSRYCDCCDCCDCCNCASTPRKGGACDACFDCGPGDSGCIDCCPCDGCDCCPCN